MNTSSPPVEQPAPDSIMTVDLYSAKSRRNQMWWLTVLVAVCVGGVLISSAFKRSVDNLVPETVPFLSTYNKKESGYSGVYELAQKLHMSVDRWEHSYRDLKTKHAHGTLVIISPWDQPTASDAQTIARWVEEGNDLVYLDDLNFRSGQLMLDPYQLTASDRSLKEQTVVLNPDVPEGALVPKLKVSAESRVNGGQPLCSDIKGALLVETRHGSGRVLVGAIPGMCSNSHLNDPTYKPNFQFLMNWLSTSRSPILFDEKCHGYNSGQNVFFVLLRSPVGFVILQALVVLCVALISLNQRFGRPTRVSSDRKISNLEFIDGLALTYQRARARDTAWSMLYSSFKGRLCRMLSVAPHEPPEKIASAWAESTGGSAAEYEAFLKDAQAALERKHLDEKELVNLVSTLDRLAAGSSNLQPVRKIMGA